MPGVAEGNLATVAASSSDRTQESEGSRPNRERTARARRVDALVARQVDQIVCRPYTTTSAVRRAKEANVPVRVSREEMMGVAAATWRRGDELRGRFLDTPIVPLGSTTLLVLSRHWINREDHIYEQVYLRGFSAEIDPEGGVIHYQRRCAFDFARRMLCSYRRDFGYTLNPLKTPRRAATAACGLALDKACEKAAGCSYRLPPKPEFPRFLVGFTPDFKPVMQVTPAFLREVARLNNYPDVESYQAAVPENQRERIQANIWSSIVEAPDSPGNNTGLYLIDIRFCPKAVRYAEGVFEDFRELRGDKVANPFAKHMQITTANPAAQVLEAHGLQEPPDNDTETVNSLCEMMRRAVGEDANIYSDFDIFEALCSPESPLTTAESPQAEKGKRLDGPELLRRARDHQQALRLGRREIGDQQQHACADADVLTAMLCPSEPLCLTGVMPIQVWRALPRTAVPRPGDFQFTSQHFVADLWGVPEGDETFVPCRYRRLRREGN